MSFQENVWEKRLVIVLIIATIIPGVIDVIDYVIDPHHGEFDSPIYVYSLPVLIAILFWPLGLGLIAAVVVAYLKNSKRMMYVIWVVYLIMVYYALPFTMTGARFL